MAKDTASLDYICWNKIKIESYLKIKEKKKKKTELSSVYECLGGFSIVNLSYACVTKARDK